MASVKAKIISQKDKINAFLLPFLISYFVLILLPYCFRYVPTLNVFFTSLYTKVAFRGFTVLYFFVYSILVGISNQQKINIHWLILTSILVATFVVAWIVTPKTFEYIVRPATNRVLVYNTEYVGELDLIVSFGLFLCECLVFLFTISFLPRAVTSRKQIAYFLGFVAAFCATACLASYFIDFKLYFGFATSGIVNEYGISSIFHNKNEFGIFVFLGCLSSGFLCCYLPFKKSIPFLFGFVQFVINSLLIKCFTAALPCLFLAISISTYAFVRQWNSHRLLSVILLILLGCFFTGITLCVALPTIRGNVKIFGGIYNTITTFGDEISSRTDIWDLVPLIMDGPSLFIGKTDAIANAELLACLSVKTVATLIDFHDSFVSFLTSHGLIGLFIYLAIHAKVVKSILELWQHNERKCSLLLILFFACILFSMPETYTLFINMSASTFPITILFLVFLPFLVKEFSEKKPEPNTSGGQISPEAVQ